MTDGVFTEREWLRNGGGVVRSPAGHWGALCTRPAVKKSIHRNRKLHGGMLAASLMVSALIALCFSAHPRPRVFPLAAIPAAAAGVRIRQVDGLTFDAPTGGSMRSITCTEEELLAGKLLLLDEPESALDFRYRYRLMDAVRASLRERGSVGLVALHDPALALNGCDQLILLEAGRLAGVLRPAEDPLPRMQAALARLYGPISLATVRNAGGEEQLVLLREREVTT